jgi:hypothetical protein
VQETLKKPRLKEGLTKEHARDIVSLLVSADPYQRLVRDAGCSREQYEAWLAETLCQQLLE